MGLGVRRGARGLGRAGSWEEQVLTHRVFGAARAPCTASSTGGSGGGWRGRLLGLEGRLGRKEKGAGY